MKKFMINFPKEIYQIFDGIEVEIDEKKIKGLKKILNINTLKK